MRIDKRKIFLIAAIAVIASLTLAVFAGCSTPTFDGVKHDGDYGDEVFSQMQYLAENHADRTMASQGELEAARYIASVLSGLGYEGELYDGEEEGIQSFTLDYTRYDGSSASKATAYNVEFKKKVENAKGEILLSTQYDNLYGEKTLEELWKADGSYESGASTAVLLTLANLLSEVDCEYDITFAFFTGGSYLWQGAYHYATHLKNSELENISLMINFSMLGGGDNLYLYASETSTDYGAYLNGVGVGLTALPKDKNATDLTLLTEPLYAYSHIGMLGNHYYFMSGGVPTANFLSLNWSRNDYPFITEMKDQSNVYHTSKDTLANMIERRGEENIKNELSNAVNSVLGALDKQNGEAFDQVLSTAREQSGSVAGQGDRASSLIEIALKISVVAVFFAIALTVRNYVRKNRDKYIKEAQSEKENVVQPFDFSSYPKDGGDGGESKKSSGEEQENQIDDPFI